MYRLAEIFQVMAPFIVFITGVMEIAVGVMESRKEKEEKAKRISKKEYSE